MIIGTNFKLSSKKYLDNRQQCASLNDLIINKDSILYPQGFEVYCIKEKAWYQNVSEGDTPEWKIRQSGTSEGGASIDDTKISATTTWSSEYIYDMKLELQDLITQTEDYVTEIDGRLLYVEGRLTSIGSFDGSYDSLTNKPEFPSLQGYATHEYVDEVIANIGKIEGTKDYNELINQPINNVVIEYIIDGRLIVNVDYLKVGKWYIVNTDLNEEYNSATSFSLVYYLSSDSYSIINTFENEDMHSLIYVSSEDEKEIKIKYITVNGETYELIYNKETNEKTLNLLSSSGNGNGGFSGDYNDLENRPCYEDEGDIPEYLNIEIYSDTDFSNKESIEIINGTADNGNCITYRKYVKLFSDITIDMINTMKEYGVFKSEYEGQLIEYPLIDMLDESQADRGMYFIGLEFEFILQATEGYYLPENGLWYMESYVDRDLNGNLIAEYKTVDDFNGILLIKDNGKLNTGTIKQLDEKFIPDTIATKDYVDNAIININSIIRPYEVFRVEETIFGKTGYIDVETMEPAVKYGLTEEYLDCSSFAFVIPTAIAPYSVMCIAASFQVSDLMVTEKWEGDPSKGEEGLYIIVKGLNIDYKINIKHKESKDGITIESIRNTKYLDINNTKEFIPTGDYQPTTKKYVDDLVSNVDIDLSDYITNTELEGKGYITEIPSEYITDIELEGKGYITEIPSEYITDIELEGKGYVTDTELEEEMIFETDSLTVNSLGGISANTDLNGLTVKEILNKLLFPYIEPVIAVAATPNGGTYEKGSTQTITNVKVVVTKKSEKITKIEVLNGTQVLARQQDEAINNGGTFNYNVNVSVPSTNKQLTVKVTDNSGNAITKTTNAFTFVYPYYYGVCDEGTTINGDLIKSLTKSVTSKGTKTVTYTTNNQRMIFAYPKSYGVITKILDPNSFDVTSTFTMSQITIIGLDGTGQSYYVYVNSPSTVSNFNMKFSY